MAVTLDFNKLRDMNDSLQKKNEDEEKTTYKKVNGNVVTGTQVSLDFDRLRDMNEALQSARKIRETLAAKRADAEAKAGVTQKSTASSASSAQSILPTTAVSKLSGNSKTGTTVYTPGGTSKKATATPLKSDEADSLLPSSASQTALSTMADRQSAAQSVLDAAKLSQSTAANGVDTAKLAVDTSDAGALRSRIESLQKEANRLTEAANEAGSSLGTPLAQRQSQSKKLSGAAAEIQARIDQLDSKYKTMTGKTAQDVNFSDWLGGVVDTGLNQFNQSVASTLDFVLPTELLLGEDNDPISKLNEYYSDKKDTAESDLSATSAAMGKGWGTAGNLGASVVGAVPNAVIALLSGGSSLAGNTSAALAQTAASEGSGLGATITSSVQSLVKNPSFWTSVAQTTGPAYDEAKASGSSELEATATALMTGLANSIVEMGGGLETLPSSLQSGSKSAIREWVSSMLDEGKEEVIQGAIENLTAKMVYDKDRAWFSTEDTDAVINPVRAAQEFGGGALAGGILGGVQAGVVNAVNSNTNTDTDFYSGLGSRFSNLGGESIQSIVNSGLESDTNTESYQYAQQAQNILDRGGTLTDDQLGRLYAANVEAVNTETGVQNTLENTVEAQEETPAGRTLTAPLAAPVTAQEIIQDLTAQGVDAQTAQSLGETIAAISGNRAARIAQNEQALSELETLTGTTINTDAPLSQVKTAIQNAGIQAQSGAETAQTGLINQDTLEPIQTAQGDSQDETGARIDALVRGEANGQFAQTNTQSTQTKKADVSALGVNAGQAGIYLRTSGLSEQAVQAAADSYDGNMETQADYLSEFVQVYSAAKSGQTLPATKTLSLAQRVAASEAGAQDGLLQQNQTGGDSNVGETVRVRQGGQRNDSAGTQGQAGTVAAGTGETGTGAVQGADAGVVRRGSADSGAAGLTVTGQVTTAGLGIGGGSSADTLYTVSAGTQATQAAKTLAKERGLRLVLFAGGDLTISGQTGIRGYISGDRVFVRADDPDYTAEQLMRHEAGHDMISKGEMDPAEVRARLREKYSEAEIQALGTLYAQLYSGTGLSAEEIWEEVICDSLGDMNAFSETAVSAFMEELQGATRQAAQTQETAQATERTTVPPEGKYSRSGRTSAEGTDTTETDSEGRALTAEQAEFFKDSKVRDAQGRLLTLFHQTENEFTVFDTRHEGAGTRDDQTPFGIFMKTSSGDIGLRGRRQMELYANITAPLQAHSREDLMRILEQMSPEYHALQEEHRALDSEYDKRSEEARRQLHEFIAQWRENNPDAGRTALYDVPEFDKYFNAETDVIDEWTTKADELSTKAKETLTRALRNAGYDGVIMARDAGSFGRNTDAYIALDPEQVKNVSNQAPTNDPDIRFSMRLPMEETEKLLALHNLTSENLADALELGGLPMPSIAVVRADAGHSKYGPISLVFDKSTIDPEVDRRNKVYGGDAWTPTAVSKEYRPSAQAEKRLHDKYYELARRVGRDQAGPLYPYATDLEDALNRNGGEQAIIKKHLNDTGMMNLFLADTGRPMVQNVQKEIVTRISATEQAQYDFIIDALGEDVIRELYPQDGESPMAARKRWNAEHGEALEDAYRAFLLDYGMEESEINAAMESPSMTGMSLVRNLALKARNYLANGAETRKTEYDAEATKAAILDAVDQNEYRQWLSETFSGLSDRTGVYNGKDIFTNMGNRRSWAALHDDYTLENIVKAMGREDARGEGINGASASGLHAMATPSYSNISQVKGDTGRLERLGNIEWTALESDIDHAINSISDALMVEYDIDEWELNNILLEAARAKGEYPGYDKYDIVKTFSQYGYDITIEEAERIQEILDAAAEMPTEYFEAKPERAVGFDEVLAAVVPDDTEAGLLQRVQEAGLNVLTYEAGNDADRLEKVNSVEGARFSRRGKQAAGAVPTDTLEQARAEARALQQENDRLKERLEKAKGQVKRTSAAQRGVRSEDTKRLARSLVKEYGSQADVQTVADSLKALGDYLVREDSYYGKAKDMAIDAAREIVENASVEDEASLGAQYEDARAYLKTVRIEIGDDWRQGGVLNRYESSKGGDGWNNLRKQYFGRLNLRRGTQTNVDAVYADLSEQWPGLFPSDVMNAEDQFDRIVEVRDALDPQQVNPYDYYMAEAVEALSYDIMDRMLGDEVRQNPETFADKAEKRRIRDVGRAKEQGEARLERLQEQAKAKLEMAVEKERAKRDAQVQRILDRNRQTKENARARKADSQARDKLLKTARRLKTLKTSNANRAAIDALIGDLDTVAKSMTGTTLEKLTNLRDWYDSVTQESSPNYDPDFIVDKRTQDAIARLSKRQIKDLSIGEVQELTEALLNIENEIRTEKRLIDSQYRHDIYVAGTEIIRDVENTKGSRNGLVDRFIVTETLSPEREIRRITGYKDSDPLNIATQELAEGQRAMLDFQMRAENLFSKWANDKKFTKRFSGKDAQEVSISGVNAETGERVTVKITPAMRASLWLHAMNDQNMRHVTKGGVTIPDMALYKKGKLADAYAKGVRVRLTRTDIASIAASMTEGEKAFARAASGYFNGMSQREINAVSLELKGYELAGVESYFPIRTDSAFTKADFESVKNDGTIEGMGFLKERQNAANPILLRDLDAELNQSIRMTGKYVGLAVPVRNFNKLFNTTTKETVEGSAEATANSVAAVIGSKWGAPAKSYIEKMMTDLQNPVVRQDVWGRALDKVRSAYAGSVLTLNLSIAMKQAASYPTAAAELGWAPLAQAMKDFGSVDLDLIAQYTPLQWYRSKGFSTQELGDMASRNKSLPKVLNWIQGMDVATTRKLWKASEYYVRANEKGLKRGSEDYYKAVAEVYNRVIENTQPNYTTMQRPQLLRSDNTLMQNLQMFKTQPFQNFNVLYDAGGNLLSKRAAYLNEGTAESKTAYKEAGKRFGWAATSQVVQLAVFAAMTAAWNALRNKPDKYEDEDGDVTLESILKGIGKDMLSGTASMVPFGSDLWEMGSSIVFGETYYGFDSVTESAIDDLFSAFTTAADSVSEAYTSLTDEEGEGVSVQSGWLDFDDVFGAVSKVLGIPYDNVINLFKVGFERAAVAIEGEYLGEYHTLWLSKETGSSEYYDLLYEAYTSGDSEQYQALYDRMVADGYDEDGISSKMESRMKKAAGVDSVDDLEQRYLSPTAQVSYDSTMDTVTSSFLWSSADSEQQAAIEALTYELYAGTDSGAKLQEKVDGGAEYGLSEDEYLLYRLALSIVDEPTESGNLGSYTQAETEAAIRLLTGLTSQEKAYLWQSQNAGWSAENNPFG